MAELLLWFTLRSEFCTSLEIQQYCCPRVCAIRRSDGTNADALLRACLTKYGCKAGTVTSWEICGC
jgi:hypothetical protein